MSRAGVVGRADPEVGVSGDEIGRLQAPRRVADVEGARGRVLRDAGDVGNPTSFLVWRLRKPDALVHHVAMAAVAGVGALALPVHCGVFYLGVSELSSLPLLAYDQLSAMTEGDDEGVDTRATLIRLQEAFIVAAAPACAIVRA